ncbi:hypothetical protein ACFORO_00205 [Amycolatopsis halotolerans]|uniref:Uncharacterized protein n=1 Tax=Amycolatopsis halotolerans TaxID=330083 RepID=A0ABV7Q9L0_9PSEU
MTAFFRLTAGISAAGTAAGVPGFGATRTRVGRASFAARVVLGAELGGTTGCGTARAAEITAAGVTLAGLAIPCPPLPRPVFAAALGRSAPVDRRALFG